MMVDSIQKLIQAAAALMWPLIVIVLILRFKPALSAIIDSAKSREFTLEVGGQKLTMKEANQVQQNLIADLQQKVSEIQIKIESPTSQQVLSPQGDAASLPLNAKALLWVDDNPKNNSYFVQQLSDLGIRVDLAVSTADGISHFESKKYDYVISDMGRLDGESYSAETSYNATAGIDLLKYVRKRNREVPFVIFCSARAKKEYGQIALDSGASAVTSSPTELFGILNLAKAKNTA